MLRKIAYAFLGVVATVSTPSYSAVTHTFQKGVTIEYELPPNEPQLFINYMFWAIEANCKMTSEDESNVLFVEAIAKKGKINDVILTAGQSMIVDIRSGDNLKVSADSGAKVQITNKGEHTVHAVCST